MNDSRRSLITRGAAGLALLGAAAGGGASAQSNEQRRQLRIDQDLAARDCSKAMNKYELYLSQAQLHEALALYDLSKPDVQADVGFGLYYGPASVKRLFIDVHGALEGDADQHTMHNGAFFIVGNTSEIIEVAEDLQTAKGAWLCFTASTPGNEKTGYNARTGFCRRVADFVFTNGEWKIWHYFVYGLASEPAGKLWTDPAVFSENAHQVQFTGKLAPDAPHAPGIGTSGAWLPNRPITTVKVPEPYRTFLETFSYAVRS